MNTTSESLLLRLQEGAPQDGQTDEKAWETFVQLYTPWIFYWATTSGLNRDDAKDLVQDVLTLVYRKLPDFRYDSQRSFRGWLKTVTLNRFRDLVRKKRNVLNAGSDSQLEHYASMNDVSVSSAESTWDIHHARLLVQNAMKRMQQDFQPGTWKALTLVLSGECTVELAAEQTGVSHWTIYSARSRLMKRLREELLGLL